jgi:integrase
MPEVGELQTGDPKAAREHIPGRYGSVRACGRSRHHSRAHRGWQRPQEAAPGTAIKLVQRDPTAAVTYPVAPRTKGFPEWTEDDVRKWEAAYPIGTRERVWLDVVLYTGARRGDAHRIGRQHLRPDGTLSFITEKTETPVTLPVLPALRRTIEAGRCGDLAFVCQRDGRPYGRKESFGNVFSDTARKLGIKKSLHGIRKIAAQRCAEAGATVHELNAIFGWTGTKMALRYTEAADRKRLAATGMAKLNAAEQTGNSIPSPTGANAPHPDFSIKKSNCYEVGGGR